MRPEFLLRTWALSHESVHVKAKPVCGRHRVVSVVAIIFVHHKRTPQPDFQQTNAKAVDVVLHRVVLTGRQTLSLWVPIKISRPLRVTKPIGPAIRRSGLLEAYEEEGTEPSAWAAEADQVFRSHVLVDEAEHVYVADGFYRMLCNVESFGETVLRAQHQMTTDGLWVGSGILWDLEKEVKDGRVIGSRGFDHPLTFQNRERRRIGV